MRSPILQSLALVGSLSLTTASDIVSLLFPFADPQELVGEVIGIDGPTTTYVISCPADADPDNCGFSSEGQTITQNFDAQAFEFTYKFGDYSLSESCRYRSTTWVSCWASNTQANPDFTTVTSGTMTTDLTFLPVTITATNLAEPASTATGGASTATATSTSTTATPADSAATTSTPSSTSGSTKETETPNAGVPRVTGAAQWVVGGAGMALALAMA